MIRIAINLFDGQGSRKHRNPVKYDNLSKSAAIGKQPYYDQYSSLHELLEADLIFGLSKTCHYYRNV